MGETQQRESFHRKRRSSCVTVKGLLAYCLIVFLLTGVIEYIYKKFFYGLTPIHVFLGSLAFTVLSVIYSLATEHQDAPSSQLPPAERKDIWADVKAGLRVLYLRVRNNSAKFAITFCALSFLLASVLACFGVCGGVFRGIRDVVEVIVDTPDEEEKAPEPTPSPVQEQPEQPPPPVISTLEPEQPQTGSFILLDPGRLYQLDQEMYNHIYFLDGAYQVKDWENDDEVEAAVYKCIQAYVDLNYANQFDGYATVSVEREVVWASEQERELTNSGQLEQIIEIRKDVFEKYPKFSIGRMIAESYHRFALEYIRVEGNFSTIEYYYGHSIKWLLKTLSYASIDRDTICTLLSSIQTRYHDIWSVAPRGSDSAYYAQKLYDAFRAVSSKF